MCDAGWFISSWVRFDTCECLSLRSLHIIRYFSFHIVVVTRIANHLIFTLVVSSLAIGIAVIVFGRVVNDSVSYKNIILPLLLRLVDRVVALIT